MIVKAQRDGNHQSQINYYYANQNLRSVFIMIFESQLLYDEVLDRGTWTRESNAVHIS